MNACVLSAIAGFLAVPAALAMEFSPMDRAKVTPLGTGGARVEMAADRPWTGVSVALGETFDATRHEAIDLGIRNPGDRVLHLTVQLKTKGEVRLRETFCVEPGESVVHRVNLLSKALRLGFPLKGIIGHSPKDVSVTLADARTLTVFEHNSPGGTFEITSVGIVGETAPSAFPVPEKDFFPFCDRYGQFRHADWPGKVHSDGDLARAREQEAAWLDRHAASPIADADRFGGWAKGPRLKATGAFRVEKVDGRWWFVDPDGRLFFSAGIVGVRNPTATPIRGRENYFESLEGATDNLVNFGLQNLGRKYGAAAIADGTVNALNQRRLGAWGFNTIGNWSDPDCWGLRKTAYTDHFKINGPTFPTLGKKKRTMIDVFADPFARNVRKLAEECAKRSGEDPWCLGWFVDNELQWGSDAVSLARWVLAAPETQPARIAFVKLLRERHGAAFDPKDADDGDCAEFLRAFADRYYRTVSGEIRRVAPKRLYLGTRFCNSRVNRVVWQVASEYCDVLSENWYAHHPNLEVPPGIRDRPLLIGEFHFGALDRGNLLSGVVPTANQADRAAAYVRYMREAIASPRIVGAHWFIYRDQPLTGRPRDGEAYQAGFVDVADRPYPEMVKASRAIAADLYRIRTSFTQREKTKKEKK